jgi:hypothetical protein
MVVTYVAVSFVFIDPGLTPIASWPAGQPA